MIGISVNFKDFSYLAVHQSPGSLMVLICYGSVLEMHDPPPPPPPQLFMFAYSFVNNYFMSNITRCLTNPPNKGSFLGLLHAVPNYKLHVIS